MKTVLLIFFATLISGYCMAQTILYKKDGIVLLYKNCVIKQIYCNLAKKNLYLVESCVYVLNTSGRNAYFNGAVFAPEETMISGNCLAQDSITFLGDYLIYFDDSLVKSKSKITKISKSWVFDPNYTPDWNVNQIYLDKITPYSLVNKSGMKSL